MKPYPSYKESGVDWIGKIPSHWAIGRIGHYFRERKETVDDRSYPPLSVTMNGILNQLEGVAKTDNNDNRKKVCKDDFVINSRSDRKGASGLSFRDGSVSLINTVLEPISIHPPYTHHIFKSYGFVEEYFKFGRGIHLDLWSTKYSTMKNIKIPDSSIQEQQQISKYLDWRTEQIASLIEKTKEKIELLKEQRTTLINTVVTKGLNPNVEMKDSGVEWIGYIPSDWKVRRLWSLGVFSKGRGIKKDEVKSTGVPCIRYGEIYTTYNRVVYSPVSFIDEKTTPDCEPIQKGDVLFTGSGETLEDIGKSVVYFGDEQVFVGGDIIIFRPNIRSNPLFLSYLLNSYSVKVQNTLSGRGGIIVHIYPKQLKEIKVSLPPMDEQNRIVEFLDKRTKQIDLLIRKENQRTEILKEYRQSLISEVVTGKVDVREEVIL